MLQPMGLQRVEHDLASEQQQFLNTGDLSQASSDFQLLFVEIKPTLMKYSRVVLDDVVVFRSLSCVQLFATLWTVAHQAPVSMGISRQEYWSGLPFPPQDAVNSTSRSFVQLVSHPELKALVLPPETPAIQAL